MKITRTVATAVVAVVAATTVAFAQGTTKPMPKMSPNPMMSPKPMMSSVYVCKMCKMGYTDAQAKTMMMKDPMGHKLVKMAKLPMGYKMAPAKPMGGKMAPKMAPKPKM